MNRKSKIIVSVVGIAIVLLALLGITYAYYLTRIQGNTNTNSISVTTADLKLVYGDGESELVTASDIMPGTTITKDFTITNSGKSKVEGYLVVLEKVTNELARKEDLVYTLECKLADNTSCGTVTETIYPSITTSVIFTNDIDIDVTHYYTLTVTYKNLEDEDQSEDMGKTFFGRVNIMDGNTNPYTTGVTETDNSSLVYNIINNSMNELNGTIYSPTPLTTPVLSLSGENEKTLSITQDNFGTSYYFRGDVQDNYVEFADMCFRIVRIEGDGGIKLAYAGSSSCSNASSDTGVLYDEKDEVIYARYGNEMDGNTTADYLNYKYSLEWEEENEYYNESRGLREQLELWYTTNVKNYEHFLKNDLWCLEGNNDYIYDWDGNLIESDNQGDYDWNYGDFDEEDGEYGSILYTSGNRLLINKTTSLKCDNETLFDSYYGTLLADEITLSGGKFNEENKNYYLYENVQTETYSTFSVIRSDFGEGDNLAFVVRGALNEDGFVYVGYAIRPSITLLPSTKIVAGGVGTKTNPYVIDVSE